MKILIAEDDPTSRLVLEIALKKASLETVSAENGEIACRLARDDETVGLAILDWNMPILDGLDACREIRALRPSNPIYIMMLTTRDGKDDVVQGLEAGADDYMNKPFDRNELLARVRVGMRVVGLQKDLNRRIRALEEAQTHIKTLQEILPFCMHCHRIRTDQESWERIETYLETRSGSIVSHGLCPECLDKYYPETPDGRGDN